MTMNRVFIIFPHFLHANVNYKKSLVSVKIVCPAADAIVSNIEWVQ